MADIDIWKELRKAFDKDSIGLLPKISCSACAKAQFKNCGNHRKQKCNQCGNYITEAHIHLDYVGHAAVTDRLNNVAGPKNWSWEPLAFDDNGLPRLDKDGNLWIKLTIDGVTKLGYGDGSNSIKELIGDALRNAAMRFGVALDLWSKEELESIINDPQLKNEKPTSKINNEVKDPPAPQEDPGTPATDSQKSMLFGLMQKRGITKEDMPAALKYKYSIADPQKMTGVEAKNLIDRLTREGKTGGAQ